MWLYILIAIIVVIVVYVLFQYNGFIKLKNLYSEAFSTMDVYLKKRWDLIPNLVEVVKGYATYEKDLLEGIVSLRNSAYDSLSISDKLDTNERLSTGLSKIMAIAENYPDLKASQNFLDLSNQLVKVEDEIANSRKYYNAVVRKLNIKLQLFPSNMVAAIFGFKTEKMFEASAEEKNNIKVGL